MSQTHPLQNSSRVNYIAAPADTRPANAVTLRMGQFARLSRQELEILQDLPQAARHYPAQTRLCVEGRVQSPLMLLSGWAYCERTLRNGRRQIIGFILPGDAIGSIASPSRPALMTAFASTPVVVTDAWPLLRSTDEGGAPSAGLAKALAAVAQANEGYLCNQITRIGRQTAYERLVHLILEIHARLRAVGLANGYEFPLPLTQRQIADALGMGVVHTNRTLQQIRRDKLLEMRGGRVVLHQTDQMRALTGWVDHSVAT